MELFPNNGSYGMLFVSRTFFLWQTRIENNVEQHKSSALNAQNQALSTMPGKIKLTYSLSIILPAHNEEVAIGETVRSVRDAVSAWTQDFEIIIVNDGSKDRTREIVESLIADDTRIRLI